MVTRVELLGSLRHRLAERNIEIRLFVSQAPKTGRSQDGQLH